MIFAAAVRLLAQALLIKSVLSQCIGRTSLARGPEFAPLGFGSPCGAFAYDGLTTWAGNNFAYEGIYAPSIEISPTSGGALPVSSASSFPPVGLAVESENVYEGALAAAGELPFVGTVAVEGVLPTAGTGAVNHACGNGVTMMVSQNTGPVTPSTVSVWNNGIAGNLASNVYGSGIGTYGALGATGVVPAAFTPAANFGFRNGITGLGNFGGDLIGTYPAGNWATSLAAPGFGSYGVGTPALAYDGFGSGLAPYGGAGEGNVAVAGELPVAGSTALAGQVPIMGAVNFEGPVAAAGVVSIGGKCDCGCGSLLY